MRSSLIRFTVLMALAVMMGPSAALAGPIQFRISSIVTPDGRVATNVSDINASGQMLAVIDDSQYLVNPDFSIVRRQGGNSLNDSGQTGSIGINNAGQTLSRAEQRFPNGDIQSRAVLVSKTGETMLELPSGASGITPTALNNRGDVVGYLGFSGYNTTLRTDYWLGAFVYIDGEVKVIPSLPGARFSKANSINDHGQVVGNGLYGGQAAFLYEDGKTTSLGTLGGAWSAALDINNLGKVVGWSETTPDPAKSSQTTATLYSDGVLLDLQSLIPADSEWTLSKANAINDSNQIVGFGYYQGEPRAFLLTPTTMAVPEPSTLMTLVLASMALGLAKARRRRREMVL